MIVSYTFRVVKQRRDTVLEAKKAKQATVTSVTKKNSALILNTEHGKIKLEPFSDAIIRVVYTLSNEFSNEVGLGIVASENTCKWTYEVTDKNIILKTKQITLVVSKQTSAFAYYDAEGKLLVKEPDKGGKYLIPFDSYKIILDEESEIERIQTPDGIKEVVRDAKKIFSQSLYHTRMELEWSKGEALYGLGQQEEGILNLRGTRQYIHQANMKIAMPIFVSTKGYGILLDTYSPIIFNDNEYGSYIYNEAAKELDYYFIHGKCFDDIVMGYRKITGKAVMLPKWAFGFIQSQERYESQQEIIDTVKKYREEKVPLDCIVLDWKSWEGEKWGQKSFDPIRFPEPEKMIDILHENGVHFMISIWPNMAKESENYKEMVRNNGTFQKSEIYNAFDEKSRALYWKQANDGLFSKGVDAWWCDASEPFSPEWNSPIKPEPDQNYLEYHNTAKIYMDELYTNAYPLMHSKTIFEGQRSVTKEKRVVNLTRSGYTGQQKYGTILWSGDISAKWETLKKQIPAGLNLCVTGLPYWTLDIGAFFVKKGDMWFWDGDYEEGCEDMGYRELYTRWYQLGTFLPIFRSHGTDTRREIWNYGNKGEMFYDVIAKFTELRYRLLPYIYSLAGMVTLRDYTIMRLLAFDFLEDSNVYDIQDQFMFGNALMICPVTHPMYYGPNSVVIENVEKVRQVYLPKDTIWYDFWTNEAYQGGQEITAKSPIDILPIYVKAGSIVPTTEPCLCSRDSLEDKIILTVYPGADGEFTLYQDENDNYNYENGEYATIDIQWIEREQMLLIKNRIGSYKGMPETIHFMVKVIGGKSYSVTYHGLELILK